MRRSNGWRSPVVVVAMTLAATLVGPAGPAESAFPGSNGKIAFTSNRDTGFPELFLVDPATRRDGKLAAATGAVDDPAWSADGDKLAFTVSGQLTSSTSPSRECEILNDDSAFQPSWSPDGATIAFTRFDAGRQGIWRMNADGSGVEQRLTDGADQDPAWSPDGGSIAFTRSTFGRSSVYVMNTDGSAQIRVQRR